MSEPRPWLIASWSYVGGIVFLACAVASPVCAQDAAPMVIVADVHFTGNELFTDATLQQLIRTAPNRRFLGIQGLTWWLWLYRVGESGILGTRVSNVFMAGGEPPAILDSRILSSDMEQLKLFYERKGFRSANIEARVDSTDDKRKVQVTFVIDRGPATYIRKVVYTGLDSLTAEERRFVIEGSLLLSSSNRDNAVQSLRFSESLLLDERQRLLSVLRDAGYAIITRDSIRAIVTLFRPDSFDVTLQVHAGSRYRFGSVHFEVAGPEDNQSVRIDTLEDNHNISWRIQNDRNIDVDLLVRSLRFSPGEWYNESRLLSTKRRLEATGVFAFTDIVSLSPAFGTNVLGHHIRVRTRARHRFQFETFTAQRSGVLGSGGSEFGGGLGTRYQNNSLFGRAETLRLTTKASVVADIDQNVFSSAQAEMIASLALPYLMAPLNRVSQALDLYQERTVLSFSLLTARREDLSLAIRGRGAARLRFELQHSPTVTSFVDVIDTSLSNPDTLRGFDDRFLERILGTGEDILVTDPVQRAQILEDYTQPQINNALRYTIRAANVNPLRRERGYSYEAALEIGGNLPYLLDAYVFSPGVVEGSLPGLSRNGSNTRLVYRRYLRIVGDVRRYHPVGHSTTLAWKITGGWAHPTGRARVVPFDRRFYSGGATSVRGWRLRQLGPGTASFQEGIASDATAANILGGDIKLETSVELRSSLIQEGLGASWIIVLFADAGNIWFGPRNPGFGDLTKDIPEGRFVLRRFFRELGVGSGMGLRVSWEYLVMRFDLASRVYDPAVVHGGWFPNGLRRPVPYFGIGHAF